MKVKMSITMTEKEEKPSIKTGKRTTLGLNEVRDAIEEIVNQSSPQHQQQEYNKKNNNSS